MSTDKSYEELLDTLKEWEAQFRYITDKYWEDYYKRKDEEKL